MEEFHVEYLENKNFRIISDPEAKRFLQKWSLDKRLHLSGWAFNQAFHPLKIKDLIVAVINRAKYVDANLPDVLKDDMVIEPVPCSVTSMEFFDRLLDPANGVVNRSGDGGIRGCFEDVIHDIIVADELRQMLLNESSEVYPLFSEIERKELIFRLLMHFALGGQYCQYEDRVQPYLDVTITAYKTLLNVQKDPDTGDCRIRSKCFCLEIPGSYQNFIYIIIDPGLREATVFAHRL